MITKISECKNALTKYRIDKLPNMVMNTKHQYCINCMEKEHDQEVIDAHIETILLHLSAILTYDENDSKALAYLLGDNCFTKVFIQTVKLVFGYASNNGQHTLACAKILNLEEFYDIMRPISDVHTLLMDPLMGQIELDDKLMNAVKHISATLILNMYSLYIRYINCAVGDINAIVSGIDSAYNYITSTYSNIDVAELMKPMYEHVINLTHVYQSTMSPGRNCALKDSLCIIADIAMGSINNNFDNRKASRAFLQFTSPVQLYPSYPDHDVIVIGLFDRYIQYLNDHNGFNKETGAENIYNTDDLNDRRKLK